MVRQGLGRRGDRSLMSAWPNHGRHCGCWQIGVPQPAIPKPLKQRQLSAPWPLLQFFSSFSKKKIRERRVLGGSGTIDRPPPIRHNCHTCHNPRRAAEPLDMRMAVPPREPPRQPTSPPSCHPSFWRSQRPIQPRPATMCRQQRRPALQQHRARAAASCDPC